MNFNIQNIFSSIFFLSLIFVVYIHFLYPLLLLLVSLLKKKENNHPPQKTTESHLFSVTLLIAAYNEEAIIEEKILNSLNLTYPKDLLEIIVFSDGSTDRTDSIVRRFKNRGVKLIRIEGRLGKTICQNLAARQASGQVIVYSDATSIYRNNAVSQLIKRFSKDNVGCVIGRIGSEVEIFQNNIAQEETLYLKFSQWIKNLEGHASMPVGASGAIFAIRRNLLVELPSIANDDLLRPLSVIQQGYSVVYEPKACATERFFENYRDIFAKKIRIAKRAVFSIKYAKTLLNPYKYGLFSLQFFTKTLLRRLLLPHYILLFFSSIFLTFSTDGVIYFAFSVMTILVLLLSMAGRFNVGNANAGGTVFSKCCRFCYYYLLAITGAFIGILLGFSGKEIDQWKPSR